VQLQLLRMGKNSLDIGSNHIYEHYIDDLDSFERAQGYLLPQRVINAAVFNLNKRLIDNMILKNKFINLPYNLGNLAILKRQPEIKRKKNGNLSLAIDYGETNKLWNEDPEARKNRRYVYHTNSHSGGYIASFKWLKSRAKTKNIFGYKFVPVKQAKRDLAKAMKDPLIKVDFFEKK
jgi:hypothetical protein